MRIRQRFDSLHIQQDHGTDPVDHGLLKIADVQAGFILNLFQAVEKSITVDMQLSGCLSDIHIIVKKCIGSVLYISVKSGRLLCQKPVPDLVTDKSPAGLIGCIVEYASDSQLIMSIDNPIRVENAADLHGLEALSAKPRQIFCMVGYGAGSNLDLLHELCVQGVQKLIGSFLKDRIGMLGYMIDYQYLSLVIGQEIYS